MMQSRITSRLSSGLPWDVCVLILVGASIGALAIFAARHIGSTGFWFDESVQFWMSLGEHPFAPPFSRPGRLADAIWSNGQHNLDPGGFTVLLRWWIRAGTAPWWQRMLPFLFFLIAAGGLALIGWRKYRSVPFALLCALVPAMFPMLLDYSTEVRAYSMEFAGVVIGCALLDRIALHPSQDRFLLAAGIIFGFFLSSRYSYALFTGAAALALIVICRMRRAIGLPTTRIADLVVAAVPLAAVTLLIALYALWPQYRGRMSYQGGALLEYFRNATASSKSFQVLLTTLARNLLGPAGLPVTAAALAGGVVLAGRKTWMPGPLQRIAEITMRSEFAPFGLLCLFALLISLLAWRWHPWDMSAKWSLWLQGLSAVAVVKVSAAALATLTVRFTKVGGLIGLMLLVGVAVLDIRLATYQRSGWPSLIPELKKLESLAPSSESVAIDLHDYPTARYFYEYGPLAGSDIYPRVFSSSYWYGSQPNVNQNIRFLVSGRSIEAATKYFAPVRIVADPELPPHLFRVEPVAQTQ